MSKFNNVSCSQCGEDFGPGEGGFSRCQDHDFILRDSRSKEVLRISLNGNRGVVAFPDVQITIDVCDLVGLRNWMERKLGCLYDDNTPEFMADGKRG